MKKNNIELTHYFRCLSCGHEEHFTEEISKRINFLFRRCPTCGERSSATGKICNETDCDYAFFYECARTF